jgi:ribonucleoside-diphosphate reductase alpha chain
MSETSFLDPIVLRVIKRDGTRVRYDPRKIELAMTRAILAVEGQAASGSTRVRDLVTRIGRDIGQRFATLHPDGGTLHIEEIQDQVELGLMRQGLQKVARAYVLYREEHARQRQESPPVETHPNLRVTLADGSLAPLDIGRIRALVVEACQGLADVDAAILEQKALANLYDGIKYKDVATALIMAARPLIETEPNYSFVSARLLLDQLRAEVLGFMGVAEQASLARMSHLYGEVLVLTIQKGVALELLDEALLSFDLQQLGEALNPEADLQFGYLGLQTLYDRYFLHSEGTRIELPQIFFMRVAMGLALKEDDRNARAIEFYRLLSSFDYMC